MNIKKILRDSKTASVFVWLSLQVSNSTFNHLSRCLRTDGLGWADFLGLSSKQRLVRYPFLSPESLRSLTESLKHPEAIIETIREVRKRNVHIIGMDESAYPERVKEELGANAPPFLFFKGNVACINALTVAIVGTRRPSPAGRITARGYSKILAEKGVTVISGGARGIDTEAHCAAIESGGNTAIVIPSGILAYRLSSQLDALINWRQVLLISPFPPADAFKKRYAVFRNSIVGALADAVIVPETPLRGGTSYVIRHILRQRRPLFTVLYEEPIPDSAVGNRSLVSAGAVPLPPTFQNRKKILDLLMKNIRK
ncbi:DNA-processing protein DprA [Candidatus Sumerlaeota bacterium]|nr:DNA-processing protein DprA [Candidatus Sumerlaeota bacterium]